MSTDKPVQRRSADYTRKAGAAAIGARLRRLSERIDSDAARLYAEAGIDFEQRWFGVVNLLAQNDTLSVGDLAEALRIRHASVSETRRSLENAGFIVSSADPTDARRRTLRLTDKGRQLVERITPLSDSLISASIELDRETENIVAALERLDQALDRRSLFDRARELMALRK